MNRRGTLAWLLASTAFPAAAQRAPAPSALLTAIQGAWRGTLTYRDYAKPDRMVTLPTRLFAALVAPSELALHYVYDDGPGKTVFAYERMAFDLDGKSLSWTTGWQPGTRVTQHRIDAVQEKDAGAAVVFEREDAGVVHRHTLSVGARTLALGKEEGTAANGFQFRNRYEFTRGEA